MGTLDIWVKNILHWKIVSENGSYRCAVTILCYGNLEESYVCRGGVTV